MLIASSLWVSDEDRIVVVQPDPTSWDTWGQLFVTAVGAFIGVVGALVVWRLSDRSVAQRDARARRAESAALVMRSGQELATFGRISTAEEGLEYLTLLRHFLRDLNEFAMREQGEAPDLMTWAYGWSYDLTKSAQGLANIANAPGNQDRIDIKVGAIIWSVHHWFEGEGDRSKLVGSPTDPSIKPPDPQAEQSP